MSFKIFIVSNEQIGLTFNNTDTLEYRSFSFSEKEIHALVIKTFREKESKNIIFDDFEKAKKYTNQQILQTSNRIWVNPIITVTLAATSLTFSRELESSSYTIISVNSAILALESLGMLDEVAYLNPKQESKYIALLQASLEKNPDYKTACMTVLKKYEESQRWFWFSTPSHEVTELKAEMAGPTLFHLETYLENLQIRTEIPNPGPTNSPIKKLLLKKRLENREKGILPKRYHDDFYGLLTAMREMLNNEKRQRNELANQLNLIAPFPTVLALVIFEYLGAVNKNQTFLSTSDTTEQPIEEESKNQILTASRSIPSASPPDEDPRFTAQLCSDGISLTFKRVVTSSSIPTDAKRSHDEEPRVRGLSIFQQPPSSTALTSVLSTNNSNDVDKPPSHARS